MDRQSSPDNDSSLQANAGVQTNGSQDPSIARRLLAYWRSLTKYTGVQVEEAAEKPESWRIVAWVTAIGGLVLVLVLHFVDALAVRSTVWMKWLGVAPILLAAVLCIALLLRSYWQISHVTADDPRALLVGILSGVVAIGVCTEAFAALTTTLWAQGDISVSSPGAPSLWTSDSMFAWQLLSSAPLIDVPETLNWRAPASLTGASGGLVLAFKAIVIVPLLYIAISTFRFAQNRSVSKKIARINRSKRPRDKGIPRRPRRGWSDGDLWSTAAARYMMKATVVGGVAVFLLVAPNSIGNRAIAPKIGAILPQGFTLFGIHVPHSWIELVPETLIVLALVGLLWHGISWHLSSIGMTRPDSLSGVIDGAVAWFGLLALSTVLAAAVTLWLVKAGLASSHGTEGGSQGLAAIAYYVWHVADAIPLLEIPRTLHWNPPQVFDGAAIRWILLSYEIVVFGVLLGPLVAAMVTFSRHRRPGKKVGSIHAAEAFSTPLHAAHSELEEAERRTRAEQKEAAELARQPHPTVGERLAWRWQPRGRSPFGGLGLYEARVQIDKARNQVDNVASVFGNGSTRERAIEAIESLEVWLDAIRSRSRWSGGQRAHFGVRGALPLETVDQGALARDAITSFEHEIVTAMNDIATRVSSS